MDAKVTTQLVAAAAPNEASVTLGQGSMDVSLGSDATDVTIAFPVDPAHAVFKPEVGVLGLLVVISSQDPVADNVPTTLVEYRPADSLVRLPVERVGNATAAVGVGLYPQTDTEDFLNPGKTKLLPFLIVNEGDQAARHDVHVEADAEGWEVTVKPGASFQLAPGASVNATLMVQAPADAKEGDTARVRLAVQRPGDEAASETSYTMIVTTGVQIEDEKDTYRDDPDATAKVAAPDEGGDSPGVPGVAVLAGAGLALALRRSAGKR
jgi:hypothetical protein